MKVGMLMSTNTNNNEFVNFTTSFCYQTRNSAVADKPPRVSHLCKCNSMADLKTPPPICVTMTNLVVLCITVYVEENLQN